MSRAIGRLLAIGLVLATCLPLHLLTLLVRGRSGWPRRFLAAAAQLAGVVVRTEGAPAQGGVLLVANHYSWLDIPVLAGATGCAFVSKAEVARWPVMGALARLNATVFVERARRGQVRGQADALRDALAAGRTVALFPEGTTNPGSGLLPFRPSLFAAVAPPPGGVRVQPVAIDYGGASAAVCWPDGESVRANVLRVLSRRGVIRVRLRFLPPLDPSPDRKALAAAAQAALERAGGIG